MAEPMGKRPELCRLRRIVVRPNPISPSGAGLAFLGAESPECAMICLLDNCFYDISIKA
jgi:hypothetical protein